MSSLNEFEIGGLYTSEEIQTSLGVGNAGGVRVSLDDGGVVRRAAILTSRPTARQLSENPYHDRIEKDVLVYTGAGRAGDQTLGGLNRRLPQQLHADFPAYGFQLIGSRRDKAIGPKRWQFLGLLEYLRHYPETQVDSMRNARKAWVFELRIHAEPKRVRIVDDAQLCRALLAGSRKADSENNEDREIEPISSHEDRSGLVIDPAELERVRGRLLGRSPEQFEHLVKELMASSGFVDVSVTRLSQDGGIDVNAFASPSMWPIERLLIQVQAKRWLHTVGRREVAELRGSLEPFARGAIVTTSHYSKAAIIEAMRDGSTPITLVDGFALAKLVMGSGLKID